MRICRPRLIDKNRYSNRESDVIADHRAARFHRIFLSHPLSLSSEKCYLHLLRSGYFCENGITYVLEITVIAKC